MKIEDINWKNRTEELTSLAKEIQSIMKNSWFTTQQLSQNTVWNFEQADLVIEQLTIVGLIKTESKDGKYKHFITISKQSRHENLLNQKAYLQSQIENYKGRIDLINKIMIETELIVSPELEVTKEDDGQK